jgi:hypothetical protein
VDTSFVPVSCTTLSLVGSLYGWSAHRNCRKNGSIVWCCESEVTFKSGRKWIILSMKQSVSIWQCSDDTQSSRNLNQALSEHKANSVTTALGCSILFVFLWRRIFHSTDFVTFFTTLHSEIYGNYVTGCSFNGLTSARIFLNPVLFITPLQLVPRMSESLPQFPIRPYGLVLN